MVLIFWRVKSAFLLIPELCCAVLLLSLLWETVMAWFHKGGFNEERRFHGHTPPSLCVCAGDSDPAFIPQAWSGSRIVAVRT